MWKDFFTKYDINPKLLSIITEELKFTKPTRVQFEVIPKFINNKDVIVKACTGSGKTLAYILPLLNILLKVLDNDKDKLEYGILSVILVPTRELGIQVFSALQQFKKIIPLEMALLIGGQKLQKDLLKFKNVIPNIIVATPGRICDIDRELNLELNKCEVLIFDEADKMLEIGLFKPEVTELISKFNKQRRTGLFSATMNSQIDSIVKTGMRNPVFVDVQIKSEKLEDNFINSISNPDRNSITVIENYFDKKEEIKAIFQEIPKQLENYVLMIDSYCEKLPLLIKIIDKKMTENKKIMVFFSTCNAVDYFSIVLSKIYDSKVSFFKLHSKITQKKRKKEYSNFMKINKGVLLTTDLSSRGIDIPDLDIVVQYDVPKNEESFVHRVGRTARVGKKGESYIFLLNSNERSFLNYLKAKNIHVLPFERKINNLGIELEEQITFNKILSDINSSDKWIYDKAVKVFVSYVKFYSEHDLKLIFDIKLFDIGDLGNSLQLLRLPRVKEILGKKISSFTKSNIDPKTLVYLDSNIKYQMEEKAKKAELMKEEKEIKKQIAIAQKENKNFRTRKDKKKTKQRNTQKEWDDFADEERLFKKLKQGKISKEEYDKIFMKNIN